MEVKASVQGLKEVEDLMRRMPNVMRTKAGHRALAAGANVIKKAAVANLKAITAESKVATGTLANGIRIYKMKKKRGMLRVGVMVQKGLVNKKKIVKGKPVRVGLYASVLEYGKSNQPPRSWLRSAAKQGEGKIASEVEKTLAEQLTKIVEAAR